jgi:hypothetical protein
MFGSVAANSLTNSKSTPYTPSRLKKVNSYVWEMHKQKNYTNDYLFYVKFLENSTDVNHLDTVAHAYYDNGHVQKAIEVYEEKILPWLKFESSKTRASLENYYKNFANIEGEIDYPALFTKLTEQEKNKNEDNETNIWFLATILLSVLLSISFYVNLRTKVNA